MDIKKCILGFLHGPIKEKKDIKRSSISTLENKYSDSELEDKEVLISNAIEFVNKTINEKELSKTDKTHYTSVLYFLRLLLDGQEKIEVSGTVVKVVNGGPWLARYKRNICIKGELIPLSLKEKLFTRSLLYDELVSLQLAAYLWSQKFKVTPELVKNHFNQHILMYNIFQFELHVNGCISSAFIINAIKRLDQDCKIRTFSKLNDNEQEHVWVTHDESTFYDYDGPHSVWEPLRDEQGKACVTIVLGAN
ncbi:28346_t:CDS:2 [Gigaspora margarita]|uniref:28346_t:CDS:1 n=1 Tax=Gigaspora margarita TaxID=4874 RepID=A0ABN7UA66_GIGMA|nr:28346_t:CDS:2 [Gigaspora margarita]